MENEVSFRFSLPYKDLIATAGHSFFEDIEDLGKSGKYIDMLIYDNQRNIRADGLYYIKSLEDIERIINEQVFVEKDILSSSGQLVKQREYVYKVNSDGTRAKLSALLREMLNSKMFDVNTGVHSRWIVTYQDGTKEAIYPWRACLNSNVIPSFITH